ncbi:type III pantothenate kinase [Butyrivibrio sp. XBB1001]|uniref:type III pantothenate kinase n=1 Tax=Butyrivibrio sp. XBB1001 TaxID=1280682 RepID=UPI00047DD3C0|nr:type III pantothenate kinase [Butyrivibrio sp. XBB1001]
MSRILTVDIGNSNIVVGFFDGEQLEFTGRIVTKRDYTTEKIVSEISALLSDWQSNDKASTALGTSYDGAILASVVPEITDKTLDALEKIIGKRPLLVGPFLRTGVDISRYKEGAIGMDRIVDVAAAVSLYGSPVMVCDLGTCTTITVADSCSEDAEEQACRDLTNSVEKEEKYSGRIIGGMICPGVQLSLDAEATHTSQLPQLSAYEVDSLLGLDTASNMMSGVVAGTGMMIAELARRLVHGVSSNATSGKISSKTSSKISCKNESIAEIAPADVMESRPAMKVVVTGGLGKLVVPWICSNGVPALECASDVKNDFEVYYEPDLLLHGLRYIYCLNCGK